MVVRDALAWGRERLRATPTETPSLDADVLLRRVLCVDRAALLSRPERELSYREAAAYRTSIERRASGEPVAYIVGSKEFFGIELCVDRRVLIPRPETEALVERALAHLPGDGRGRVVVDVGTGSGAIALAVAKSRPAARVFASDTSRAALEVAACNSGRVLGADRTVQLVHGALFAGVGPPVDVVCANLPYIPTSELAALPASVHDFEPRTALDGGADGLDVYRALMRDLPPRLAPGGVALMECDPRQARTLRDIALRALPRGTVTIGKDMAGDERVVEVVA